MTRFLGRRMATCFQGAKRRNVRAWLKLGHEVAGRLLTAQMFNSVAMRMKMFFESSLRNVFAFRTQIFDPSVTCHHFIIATQETTRRNNIFQFRLGLSLHNFSELKLKEILSVTCYQILYFFFKHCSSHQIYT